MIYTRQGDEVRIIRNCGKVMPSYLKFPSILIEIEFVEDGKRKFHFTDFLKATGGYIEIDQVVSALPIIPLKYQEVDQILKEAQ